MGLPRELVTGLHDAAIARETPERLAQAAALVGGFARQSSLEALDAAITAAGAGGTPQDACAAAGEMARRTALLQDELARFLELAERAGAPGAPQG